MLKKTRRRRRQQRYAGRRAARFDAERGHQSSSENLATTFRDEVRATRAAIAEIRADVSEIRRILDTIQETAASTQGPINKAP